MLNVRAVVVSPTNFTRQKEIEQKDYATVPLRHEQVAFHHVSTSQVFLPAACSLTLAKIIRQQVWQGVQPRSLAATLQLFHQHNSVRG